MERKTLKFRSYLVDQILNGTKTVTWRLFDDKNLTAGDQVEFVEYESGKKFAEVEITKIREKNLGDVVPEDFDGHEKIENPLEHYRELYGGRVMPETLVKMITFKLV